MQGHLIIQIQIQIMKIQIIQIQIRLFLQFNHLPKVQTHCAGLELTNTNNTNTNHTYINHTNANNTNTIQQISQTVSAF